MLKALVTFAVWAASVLPLGAPSAEYVRAQELKRDYTLAVFALKDALEEAEAYALGCYQMDRSWEEISQQGERALERAEGVWQRASELSGEQMTRLAEVDFRLQLLLETAQFSCTMNTLAQL